MPEEIYLSLSAFRVLRIKNVHPDVFIYKQSVTGTEHKQGGVQVQYTFVEENIAYTKHIAKYDYDELEQEHEECTPADNIAHMEIDCFQQRNK